MGWVGSSCCLESSGSRLAGAAWVDQRPTGRAVILSFLLGGTCCVAGHSAPRASKSPGRPGTAAAAPNPVPGPSPHPCMLQLQG